MASSKDIQHATATTATSISRPLTHHRPSWSNSLPRPAHTRMPSHSISSGSLVPPARVTRRKSVTASSASNVAAMVAAVTDAPVQPLPISTRRALSKNRTAGLPSPPASLTTTRIRVKTTSDDQAIDSNDDVEDDAEAVVVPKVRRTSEAAGAKKEKSGAGELKCDKCGKGYKHSSCLSKHLWEHTPEWSFTSKLLISKHQQVQLLEAASVLLTMNQGVATPPDSATDADSEQDGSVSPTSVSDQHDVMSSADTTPPPESRETFSAYRTKRYSSGSGHSAFARSYQSAAAYPYGSMPNPLRPRARQRSTERVRPTSSGVSQNREDDGLAAAVELLSCSFGSASGPARHLSATLPRDAPPVPNIPAQYLGHNSYGSVLGSSLQPRQTESYTRHTAVPEMDVKMDEDDDHLSQRSREPSDEDDDGVFGRMEE